MNQIQHNTTLRQHLNECHVKGNFFLQILNIFPIYVDVFSNKARFTPRSSLKKIYCRYHELIDSYEVSISQIAMDIFPFTYIFLSFITNKTLAGLDHEYHGGCLSLHEHLISHVGVYAACPFSFL